MLLVERRRTFYPDHFLLDNNTSTFFLFRFTYENLFFNGCIIYNNEAGQNQINSKNEQKSANTETLE
ncbi:hypothetical protein AMS62_24265 [Bacillus sp. FJAT-18019]|nr:hypothetical protein AMS62_24265 [Bacillus sp. FJAT-18019]